MAAKKTPAPQSRETLSAQIVVRVPPATRARLDAYVRRYRLRGLGEAVRHILDNAEWK